jgi:hypothetical protein
MKRAREYLFRRGLFDYLAQIHHRHFVGYVSDYGEVVRDEEISEIEFLLKFREQVEYLSLNRHVERRDSFIAHDEFRAEGERAGYADALSLAS